jgi:hypothetical protein
MSADSQLYGLLAEFESEDALLEAARQARRAGYRRLDAFSPHPVDGLDEALGTRWNWVPLLVLAGGIGGAAAGYALQYYASVLAYPLNVGGRPLHSWPAFIPVTFELAIFGAAVAGVLGMLALNGLPQPYHPVFNVASFARASQDRFFLLIEAADPRFTPKATRMFLASLQPAQVNDVPR